MTTSIFADLCASAWALCTLRVAVESELLSAIASGVREVPKLATASSLDPEATDRILGVLAANAIVAREPDGYVLTDEGRMLVARGRGLQADLAATLGQCNALVEQARLGPLAPGWRHVDPEVIRAQAELSAEMTTRMIGPMTAACPDVGRLLARDGARHLDIGVGAAGGAIAMCRHFPGLSIVGVDPHRVAHLEAKAAIESAGMTGRIELRLQCVEAMDDEAVFDTAFVASKFFDPVVLAVALAKTRRALVPGGCAWLAGWRDPRDPRRRAVSRLREHLWGGGAVPAAEIMQMLAHAGFVDIREAPGSGDATPLVARVP